MIYHLAHSQADHMEVLGSLLKDLVDHSDLVIVSHDGEMIRTSSLLLGIFSPMLTSVLESIKSGNSIIGGISPGNSNMVGINLPLPCRYISNLVNLLSTGLLESKDKGELKGVTEVAELLNIDLGSWQIGVKNNVTSSSDKTSVPLVEINVDYAPTIKENGLVHPELIPKGLTTGAGDPKVSQQNTQDNNRLTKYEPREESNPDNENTKENIGFVKNEREQEIDQYTVAAAESFFDNSELQFSCGQCGKSFKNKKHLDRHVITHSGKSYPCDNCDKTFTRSDKRTDHTRAKHLGGISCTDCGATFSRQDKLNSHRRRQHL